MPTVLRVKGYRFSFYSYDLGEPIYVHATKAGCEAKVWLDPLRLAWNEGFRRRELLELIALVEENRELIVQRWNERHTS
jgi:hypothetical protein